MLCTWHISYSMDVIKSHVLCLFKATGSILGAASVEHTLQSASTMISLGPLWYARPYLLQTAPIMAGDVYDSMQSLECAAGTPYV